MLSIVAVMAVGTQTAQAENTRAAKSAQIHLQLKRYYHADGFIKSIGRVAYRTIYSSNPQVRTKWKKKTRHLFHVRQDAQAKIDALRAPSLSPPHLQEFLCIHRYEGSWTDGGGPYYGGLQMDLGFQKAYGGELLKTKGTADHWTPLEQIWVAERAWKSRGFWPWPNTARFCGLL